MRWMTVASMQLKKLNVTLFPVHYNDKYYTDSLASGDFTKLGLGTVCSCGRRHFIEAAAATATALFPSLPSNAYCLQSDYRTVLNRVHLPRPDWYEELFASVLNSGMKPYEAEVAAYKSELFANLRGNVEKVLELGVGTGPNLKYYAADANMLVYGVDPNRKMEKYARVAAAEAGLQHDNFKFIQADIFLLPWLLMCFAILWVCLCCLPGAKEW